MLVLLVSTNTMCVCVCFSRRVWRLEAQKSILVLMNCLGGGEPDPDEEERRVSDQVRTAAEVGAEDNPARQPDCRGFSSEISHEHLANLHYP